MQQILLLLTTLLLLSNGQAIAVETGPQSPSSGLGYDCDFGSVLKKCRCSMGDDGRDCKDSLHPPLFPFRKHCIPCK